MPTRISRSRWTSRSKGDLVAKLHNTLAWPQWSPMTYAAIEKPGPNGMSSPGEIRQFHRGKTIGREEVLPVEGNVVLRYRLLEGIPLKNYIGEVSIEDFNDKRLVTWSSHFDAPVPFTGWIFAIPLRRFFDELLESLIKE